jgi:DNA-binding transcriptional LysR family regulator
LDVVLFERLGRSISLTEAGQALLPHAEAALAAARDGDRAARDAATGAAGTHTLRLAIVGTLADSHLVDALRTFEARFENCSVELRTATSREVSALVRSGEAHVGLRYFADTHPKINAIPLATEKLLVVVPANHRVEQTRLSDLHQFDGDRWLGFPPDRNQPESFGHLLDRVLSISRLKNPTRAVIDSLTAQKRLVEAGLGIALMPASAIRDELRIGSLRAIEITGLDADLPIVLVLRKGGYQSPLATAFRELIEEYSTRS